jgi:PAS domain-containing protein
MFNFLSKSKPLLEQEDFLVDFPILENNICLTENFSAVNNTIKAKKEKIESQIRDIEQSKSRHKINNIDYSDKINKIIDINDLKIQQKSESDKLEKMWEITVDIIPDIIFIVDSNHFVVRANKAAKEEYGLDIVGKRCTELSETRCHSGKYGCQLRYVLEKCETIENKIYDDNGKLMFIDTITPLKNGNPTVYGAVHIRKIINEA